MVANASAVVKSHRTWLAAWDLPLSSHPAVVQDWLVDYVYARGQLRELPRRPPRRASPLRSICASPLPRLRQLRLGRHERHRQGMQKSGAD